MKDVIIHKQQAEQNKTFALKVETKIREKLQISRKKENVKSDNLKHPKSGKGL